MSLEENCHSNNNKPQQPPVRDEENRRSEELTLVVEWMNNHGINTASTARESQGKRGGRKRKTGKKRKQKRKEKWQFLPKAQSGESTPPPSEPF